MDAKTNYLENAILNHMLRNVPIASPTTVYLALFTADPGEAGSQAAEVAGGGYVRQAVAFNAPSGGAVTNSGDLTFSSMPGATVTHVAIMDDVSGGNMLYYTPLPSSVQLVSGNELVFDAGTISVSEA